MNNTGMLKYLHSDGKILIETIRSDGILYRASECGSLGVLKYLIKIVGVCDPREIECILQYACENGHLKTAEFLVRSFKLTYEDKLRIGIKRIFMRTCSKGHIEMLEYLTQVFKLALNDLKIATILQSSVALNNLDLLKYLVRTFDLTSETAMRKFNIVSIYHSAVDRLFFETEMSRYIKNTFKLMPAQTSALVSRNVCNLETIHHLNVLQKYY